MIHHTPSTVFCQDLLFSTMFIQCIILFVRICLLLTSSFFQMQLSKYSGYFKNHQGAYYRELTSHSSHSSTHLWYFKNPPDSPTIGCFQKKITGHLWVNRKKKTKANHPRLTYTHCIWISSLVGVNPSEVIWVKFGNFPQLRGKKIQKILETTS